MMNTNLIVNVKTLKKPSDLSSKEIVGIAIEEEFRRGLGVHFHFNGLQVVVRRQ